MHLRLASFAALAALACGGGGGGGGGGGAHSSGGLWESTHVVPVVVPNYHGSSAALRALDEAAPTPAPAPAPSFGTLGVGDAHACGITPAGTLMCWGFLRSGQLGTGPLCAGLVTAVDLTDPTRVCPAERSSDVALDVPGLKNVTSVGAAGDEGEGHTCAVADGEAYCWGSNWFGELGVGDAGGTNVAGVPGYLARGTPTAVLGLEGVTIAQLALGYAFSCGLTTDGAVKCWGGWLAYAGGPNYHSDRTPVDVLQPDGSPLPAMAQIAAGPYNACAIPRTGGGLWCWGWNRDGQLGDGTQDAEVNGLYPTGNHLPQRVAAFDHKQLTSVVIGAGFMCALTEAGEVWCWGRNDLGQLADDPANAHLVPYRPAALQGVTVTHLSAGWQSVCATPSSGGVLCWGSNEQGDLARPIVEDTTGKYASGHDPHPYPEPAAIPAFEGKEILDLSANAHFFCAHTADGQALCWGTGTNPK